MNFLGMGPMELLVIVVLALIVFGPAKLPEIMGQVGRAIRDFRRATSEISDEFNRTIQAELAETRAMLEETRQVLDETRQSIEDTATISPRTTSSTASQPYAPVSRVPAAPIANGHEPGAVANGMAEPAFEGDTTPSQGPPSTWDAEIPPSDLPPEPAAALAASASTEIQHTANVAPSESAAVEPVQERRAEDSVDVASSSGQVAPSPEGARKAAADDLAPPY